MYEYLNFYCINKLLFKPYLKTFNIYYKINNNDFLNFYRYNEHKKYTLFIKVYKIEGDYNGLLAGAVKHNLGWPCDKLLKISL